MQTGALIILGLGCGGTYRDTPRGRVLGGQHHLEERENGLWCRQCADLFADRREVKAAAVIEAWREFDADLGDEGVETMVTFDEWVDMVLAIEDELRGCP